MGNENTRACCEEVQKDGGRSADGSRLLGNAHLDDQDGEAGDGASAYRPFPAMQQLPQRPCQFHAWSYIPYSALFVVSSDAHLLSPDA